MSDTHSRRRSSPRVGQPITERKCGVSGTPKHRAAALLLREHLEGRCAELARQTGRYGERMLQYWLDPLAPHASPAEKARMFVEDVAAIVGLESAEAIAHYVCVGLGGRYQRIVAQADAPTDIVEQLCDVASAKAALEIRTHQRLADGCQPEDADPICAEIQRLRVELDELELAVRAQTHGLRSA